MVTLRALLLLLLLALPARADSLRLIVPEMRPVVGEMIPITIRGEYSGQITLEKLIFPDSAAYDWIQTARDRWADERVEGLPYRVFERRIAVFPRRPGTLTIGPVTHQLTKAQGMTRPVFDIVAPPVTLAVTPYPGAGRPLASRHVTITDEFSADPARLGPAETFTRRITLTADGSMAHLLPPRPLIREPWLISFAAPEIRETRLTPQGPIAVAVWEWSLRPHTGEVGSLTPIRFPWFNTQIREMRGATTLPVTSPIRISRIVLHCSCPDQLQSPMPPPESTRITWNAERRVGAAASWASSSSAARCRPPASPWRISRRCF